MAHPTTLPVPKRAGIAPLPGGSLDPGQDTGGLSVARDGQRFRGQPATFSTPWLPDTPSNRHLTIVWLRLRRNAHDRPCFTWQEFAPLVGSANRQAASQHLEDCRQCGEDWHAFGLRKRTVVAAVVAALLHTPLAGPTDVVPRVQARLDRHDLRVANSESAVEPISCVPVLRVRRRQWETGHVPSQEAWLLTELLESRARPATPPAGWSVPPVDRGMRLADPTALAARVTPELPLAQGPGSLCWLTWLRTLFYWHVPLSVWGRWCGVHKTTIVRWVLGLALALWPLISRWLGERVKASMVSGDEQWLKIRGRWSSWCVVLEVPTALPVRAGLLPSRGQWACRGVGRQWRQRKKVPKVLITDGLQAYASLVPGATHVVCRLHHQQGVTHWLKPHFTTEAEIDARKPAMKRLVQTREKRTVRRRLARRKERAAEWGRTPWVSAVEAKRPQRICRVGSDRLPSTSNAVERFFRAFQRLYCTRGGFHSVLSAKRERLLFLVVSVFTQHATTGQAPIEVILPEARSRPLDRGSNAPCRALQERGDVKREAEMADVLRPQEAAASMLCGDTMQRSR